MGAGLDVVMTDRVKGLVVTLEVVVPTFLVTAAVILFFIESAWFILPGALAMGWLINKAVWDS